MPNTKLVGMRDALIQSIQAGFNMAIVGASGDNILLNIACLRSSGMGYIYYSYRRLGFNPRFPGVIADNNPCLYQGWTRRFSFYNWQSTVQRHRG